jgi:hypothetical protein
VQSLIQLEEFTNIFMALSSVSLNEKNDENRWRWTGDDKYSVSSAYECQFWGAMSHFQSHDVWKAVAEPKCRFLSWLVIHDRVLKAENMLNKNWPCDPMCSFCRMEESTPHLLTQCIYTEAT